MTEHEAVIVVGVAPGRPEMMVRTAVDLARDLRARLVFAVVDVSAYTAHETGGGTHLEPTDPDGYRAGTPDDVVAVDVLLEGLLSGQGVSWQVERLGGDPSRELARLAERCGARMIVVGTRQAGLRERVEEFFNGSVAAQLTHHQHRPVLVVPTAPVGFDQAPPWQ